MEGIQEEKKQKIIDELIEQEKLRIERRIARIKHRSQQRIDRIKKLFE